MNCALRLSRVSAGRRERGLTLVETLVAIAVVLAFFGGAILAFLQILQTKEETQARLEAVANARHALETISLEVKRARVLPQDATTSATARETFLGMTAFLTEGDRIDNDLDGQTDEEGFNGIDDDADWTAVDDLHAVMTTGTLNYAERPTYRNVADLGDAHVDQDTVFSSSTLAFETFPTPGVSTQRIVTFWVGNDFDGQPNTLMMRTEQFDPLTSTSTFQDAPIAYNVLSFMALYYDAGREPTGGPRPNPWRTDWASSDPTRDRTTVPSTPVSVYLSVVTYSGTRPMSAIVPGQKLDTVKLDTVVNVEAVLADPRYAALRQPVTATP